MPADLDVDPDSYERGVTNEEIERYRAAARRRMPFLDRGTVLGGWAGIYDDSIDAHPIVDAVPGAEGLFCALGMSGNCFKLSPLIGDLLAQRIIEGPGSTPPARPVPIRPVPGRHCARPGLQRHERIGLTSDQVLRFI